MDGIVCLSLNDHVIWYILTGLRNLPFVQEVFWKILCVLGVFLVYTFNSLNQKDPHYIPLL